MSRNPRAAAGVPGDVSAALRLGLLLALVGALHPPAARAQEDPWLPERRDVRIPMRDGKALAADLYLPGKPGKVPVVLVQTPYGKGGLARAILAGQDEGNEVSRGTVSDMARIRDRERYGYCVVDWRGFHGSRDAGAAGPGRRGLDGHDCVEWLAAQEFCDGRVGTWGGSALGRQQFETAAAHPPHLVCCVPLIAPLGQVYEGYYEGEVLLESHVRTLDLLGFGVSRTVRAFPRPDAPAWRLARSRTYRPEAIEVPCLLITGWWDHHPDQILRTFEDLLAHGGKETRAHSRLLVGPWDHVSVGAARQGDVEFPGATGASGAVAKTFLDRFLLGEENGWEQAPRVRYWQGNEGWRSAESWSAIPRGTRTLRLGKEGRLGGGEPAPGSRALRGDPSHPVPTLGGANLPPVPHGPRDQSALGSRDDVLSWETGPLESPLRLNGNAELAIEFGADRPSVDLTARLCEVREDGRAILVADAVRRSRDLRPGEPARATLRFPATAYTFPAGRALRIYLATSNSPRYERNPHTGADHWEAAGALPVEVTIRAEGCELRVPILAGE